MVKFNYGRDPEPRIKPRTWQSELQAHVTKNSNQGRFQWIVTNIILLVLSSDHQLSIINSLQSKPNTRQNTVPQIHRRTHLVAGVEVLGVDQVLADVGGRGGGYVLLDPVQFAVGVEDELVPPERVLQLAASVGNRVLQGVVSVSFGEMILRMWCKVNFVQWLKASGLLKGALPNFWIF